MRENNQSNFDDLTETTKGTAEQGALKTIHRSYNKLSGFEAMLHIINRYRVVLYPFIFLSIMGSTYSFYNDFMKVFPMLGSSINLILAFFFSVMLEIVRDGSLIALFNSKMRIPSRLLVSIIFVAVTSFLYSSHLKAIDIIEEMAVNYTLKNQSETEVKNTNPKYEIATEELQTLKDKLAEKKAEKTEDLISNSTSIHTKKREDALSRIDKIDKKVEAIEADIKAKNQEIVGFKEGNIKSIKESQGLISDILLATLILIESLAMLGAVIKFINTDNAKKEIAKHSEIIEEYVEISEQMARDNEELTKNLSSVVKGQSESNQQVMAMISDDMKESSKLNIQFIKAIAENKNEMMQQMNDVLHVVNSGTAPMFQQPTAQRVQEHREEPKPTRKIGFQAKSKEEMLSRLYQDGDIAEGKKLASKGKVIDVKKRQENQNLTDFYKELEQKGIVENRTGQGYFAKADYYTAMNALQSNTSQYDFNLGEF